MGHVITICMSAESLPEWFRHMLMDDDLFTRYEDPRSKTWLVITGVDEILDAAEASGVALEKVQGFIRGLADAHGMPYIDDSITFIFSGETHRPHVGEDDLVHGPSVTVDETKFTAEQLSIILEQLGHRVFVSPQGPWGYLITTVKDLADAFAFYKESKGVAMPDFLKGLDPATVVLITSRDGFAEFQHLVG